MKKQLKPILLFIAGTSIILTGCSIGDSLVQPAENTTKSATTPTTVIAKADDNAARKTASNPNMITITAPFIDVGTFPIFPGTFTTTGALTISGTAIMTAKFNANFTVAHCIITLTDNYGTITIDEECNFVIIPNGGNWHIASGTGAYTNLRAHGTNTMSQGGLEEDLVGVIQ